MSMASVILALLSWQALFQRLYAVRERRQVARPRSVLRPGRIVVERVHPGVGPGLLDRAGNHRRGRYVHVVGDREVAQDDRAGPEGAMPADRRAAGNRD